MELYLVQHGASKSEAEDPQRGLTEEGKRTVERMGEYLAALGLALDRIEHSDKLRARQTAEILAAKLHPANGTVQVPGLTPNDDVEPIRVRLNEETKNIMLVGHLPHLSRLVSRLIGLERDHTLVRFQMGGVVKLKREDGGRWVLCWIFTPELLPG
jgi:phosphohistidine phosphatase